MAGVDHVLIRVVHTAVDHILPDADSRAGLADRFRPGQDARVLVRRTGSIPQQQRDLLR